LARDEIIDEREVGTYHGVRWAFLYGAELADTRMLRWPTGSLVHSLVRTLIRLD
jgi:hypothetical protein